MKTPKLYPGARFGAWSVLSILDRRRVLCRCDCGAEKPVQKAHLYSGRSTKCSSCASKRAKTIEAYNLNWCMHRGLHPLYSIYEGMLSRCYRQNHQAFDNYGGRGIGVYPEWRESFGAFIRDVHEYIGPRPSPRHTLVRVDNGLDYEPGNLRWALKVQQIRNRRTTVRILHNGETHPEAVWARRYGLDYGCLQQRIQYLPRTADNVVEAPPGLFRPSRLKPGRTVGVGRRGNRWRARIGEQNLGLFDTFAEAATARRKAEADRRLIQRKSY